MANIAVEMHETGQVGGDNIIGAGLKGVVDLLVGHSHRDGFELDGKAPPEPTTHIIVVHLGQLQSADLCEQLPRLFTDAAFPEGSTGVVIGSFAVQAGADVFDTQNINEEGRKFENSFLDIADIVMERRVVEEGPVIVPDKADATGTGRYNIIGSGEILQKFDTYVPGFVTKSGVEGRLAAAGLIGVVLHFRARLFQHADHIEGGLRV
jgi:hypothetical protein